MSRPVLYADLSKKASDLLTKDFPDKNKLQLTTRTSNGVNFEFSVVKNHDDSILGTMIPKYTFARQGVTVSATADTNHSLKLEAEAVNIMPGLTGKITGDTRNDTITLESNYRHDFFTLNGSVDFQNPKGTNAGLGATVAYEGFAVGLQTKYSNRMISALNGAAAYSTPDFNASVWGMFKSNRVGLTYYQRINARASVGADASFDLTEKSSESPKLTVGGRYEVDALTAAFAKAKFDTEGRLTVSYGQRLNAFASLTVGAGFNTNNFSKLGGHNFGFTLALND